MLPVDKYKVIMAKKNCKQQCRDQWTYQIYLSLCFVCMSFQPFFSTLPSKKHDGFNVFLQIEFLMMAKWPSNPSMCSYIMDFSWEPQQESEEPIFILPKMLSTNWWPTSQY